MWLHNHENWQNLTWQSDKLVSQLSYVRHRQGLLLGKMEHLGFDLKRKASLSTLTHDVVRSSAIEGEALNPEEVRSSIARRLGIKTEKLTSTKRDIEGIVEMMLDATQNSHRPLTKKRMFDWHAALFPTERSGMRRINVGKWRGTNTDPMQVVSGAVGNEKIHFEAPSADKINEEMNLFFRWLQNEKSIDPVLMAGISHLWFLTIHPFEDGNGRIARAIADMMLARADGTSERYYSLSTQIEIERKDYYDQLETQQRSTPDITPWLGWFLSCLNRSISNAEGISNRALLRDRVWGEIYHVLVNDRQRLVVRRMLEENFKGYMNTSKYAKMTNCSTDTALRDIQYLKDKGVFIQNPGGGRSTSYQLTTWTS